MGTNTLGLYELGQIRIPKGSPEEAIDFFAGNDSRKLATLIVNHVLNDFIASRDSEGSPIDYQGWFWRSVDFFGARGVTIAEGDGRVAVCQNNKWDYAERDLTAEEQAKFLGYVWSAYEASHRGVLLSDITAATDQLLFSAGEYIESLNIKEKN